MELFFHSLEIQTCKDFEVILVDDHSDDGTYVKLIEFSKSSSIRFRLLRNDVNSGPGVARNLGIENAEGDYVMFLDADDWIEKDCIEQINTVLNSSGADLLFFDYYIDTKVGMRRKSTVSKSAGGSINRTEAFIYSTNCVWCKVYSRKLVEMHSVRFPPLKRNEDLAFNKIAISYANNIYYLRRPLYHYRNNSQSIMHNKRLLNENNSFYAINYIRENYNYDLEKEFEIVLLKDYLYNVVMTKLMLGKPYKDVVLFIREFRKNKTEGYKSIFLYRFPIHIQLSLVFINLECLLPLKFFIRLKKIIS